MQTFLDSHPEYLETYDLLTKIQKGDDPLIDRDDLKLYKYIYRKKLYRRKEVKAHLSLCLEEIVAKERNTIFNDNHIEHLRSKLYSSDNHQDVENTEIKILRMFMSKEIYFSEFKEKMFFLRHFPGLKGLFKGSGEVEFVLQEVYYKIHHQNGIEHCFLVDRILEIEDDKVLVYFYFLSPYLSESTKATIFEIVSILFKFLVLESLTEEMAFEKMAKVLLYESPKNKVLFLNTVEITDKIRVYLKIVEMAMKKSLDHKKMFLETLDILKILPLDKKNSLLILLSWAKTFIYFKNVEEGIKLYKEILKMVGRDVCGDMAILSEFYNSVVEYKETGHLNFEKFIHAAEECEDENIFSLYKWKEISLMYQ